MDIEIGNTQQLFVSCVVPKKGTPYVEILVLGNEEDLENTRVVVCNGGSQIERKPVGDVWELNWGCVPSQKVGFVSIFIDREYLGFELSVYSVIKASGSEDTEDSGVKSRPFIFRI